MLPKRLETATNDREKSERYVFIPTIVDQSAKKKKKKKTHPAGFSGEYRNTAVDD